MGDMSKAIPPGTEMPTPVPPGRFAEFAACLSEGFCPACRRPFRHGHRGMQGNTWGSCKWCHCIWEYDRVAVVPVIAWHGVAGGAEWDIFTTANERVSGTGCLAG
jgi:hypothetical protein